jgi:DNA-binding beta-propeller fold protein YncE
MGASVPEARAQTVVTSIVAGGSPLAMAVDPARDRIYVLRSSVLGSDGSLAVIDAANFTTSSVATGLDSNAVAVDPVTGNVYVTDAGNSDMTVIDGASGTASEVQVIAGPTAVAVDPATGTVGVLCVGHSADIGIVTLINAGTGAQTLAYPGYKLEALAVDTATNTFFVVDHLSPYGSVSAIDGVTGAVISATAGIYPIAVAVNPVTDVAYALNNGAVGFNYGVAGTVTAWDLSTGTTSTFDVGINPIAIAANPAANKVYVLNSDPGGTVTIIDGATGSTTSVAAGYGPTALAVNTVTNKVYVISGDNNGTLTVIDGATNATSSLILGTFPAAIAVNESTNQVYVANADFEGTVTILDGAPASTPPSFLSGPAPQEVTAGTPVVFAVSASGTPPLAYQWMFNGSPLSDADGITGSATPTLLLGAGATAASAGAYACVATNAAGSAVSAAAALTVSGTANPGHLANVSTRALVGTGEDILIAGFVVEGQGSKSLVVRGIGPSLAGFGLSNFLVSPVLSLFDGGDPANLVTSDAGWLNPPSPPAGPWAGRASPVDATPADFGQVGAFALEPGSADSAIRVVLPAGSYTEEIAGADSSGGVALAEVYDADAGGTGAQLVNISSRAYVGPGGDSLIAGFAIEGATSLTVLIRASGPALAGFGVSAPLADPEVRLFDADQNLIASNTGWAGDPQVAAVASAVGAFAWTDQTSKDSALLVTLPPGDYTAVTSGASGDGGVALIEVYLVH